MSTSKKSLQCDECGNGGRHAYYLKGRMLCHKCILKLPNTRMQSEIMMEYQRIRNRYKPKDLNT